MVKVLPEPVTPSSTWSRSSARTPDTSSVMAVGWSPFGSYSDTTLSRRVSGFAGCFSGMNSTRRGEGRSRVWDMTNRWGISVDLRRGGLTDRLRPGPPSQEEAMPKGLLFASFDFSTAHADEFHDWYDLEHIPERLRVPGFINAERWIGDENPKRRRRHLRPRYARRAAERALQGDRLRECLGLDQARHGDGQAHPALHRRAAGAGRPRRSRPAPARCWWRR